MADNGGERVELRAGDKSVGRSMRDLLPVIMLLFACVAGYLVWRALELMLTGLHQRQQQILDAIKHQDEQLVQQIQEFARLRHRETTIFP